MVDVFEDLERAGDDVMALDALDMCNKAEAAGVVLVALGVQTVSWRCLISAAVVMAESSNFSQGTQD